MNGIQLLAVGRVEPGILDRLCAFLARAFHVSCHLRAERLDPEFAYDVVRGQYHSTAILRALQGLADANGTRLLGVTEADLFVPILTFVFGEAQLAGPCALVSLHRLREEFYGMPPNAALFEERLAKEAAHELGHTLGLKHCLDWRCAMASTHAVERLDLKEAEFCARCRGVVEGVRAV